MKPMSCKLWIIPIISSLLLLTLLSCGNEETKSPTSEKENGLIGEGESSLQESYVATDRDKVTAKHMALYLSGENLPPKDLCEKILNNLITIRSAFGSEIEQIESIHFWMYWEPGEIGLQFIEEINVDEYDAWDVLNETYGVTNIRRSGDSGVILYFSEAYHPSFLQEQYKELPNLQMIFPSLSGGDSPNIYPRMVGDTITYLFRNAWGDCPAGCTNSEYWYIRIDNGEPVMVGYWNPSDDPNEPDWWQEAKLNRDNFRKYPMPETLYLN